METSDEIREARIARLERENRGMKIVAAMVSVLSFVMCVTSQSPSAQKRIDAEEFILRGPDGKVRARMGRILKEVFQDKAEIDVSGLEIFDSKGERVALLGVVRDNPVLLLNKAKTNLSLELSQDGAGGMTMESQATGAKAVLDLKSNGSTEMLLRNKGGATAQIWLLADGSPDLTLHSIAGGYASLDGGGLYLRGADRPSGKEGPSAMLRVAGDIFPNLSLFDENGKLRCVLGSTRLETTRTGETTSRPPSSLVLFDKDGKVLWSAP